MKYYEKLKKKYKSRGNVKEQRKRRFIRRQNLPPKLNVELQLIDGNYSAYAVAKCNRMKGCMTEGLIELHKCREKKCPHLRSLTPKDIS